MNASRNDESTWRLVNEKAGRFARVDLPSGEQIVISVGSATAKILSERAVLGWLLPRVIVSQRLSAWQSDYPRYNSFHRRLCRAMVLEGLLASLSRCRSIEEIQQSWQTMRNPIAVIGFEMMGISRASDADDT